jgi:hypothetical protein
VRIEGRRESDECLFLAFNATGERCVEAMVVPAFAISIYRRAIITALCNGAFLGRRPSYSRRAISARICKADRQPIRANDSISPAAADPTSVGAHAGVTSVTAELERLPHENSCHELVLIVLPSDANAADEVAHALIVILALQQIDRHIHPELALLQLE